MNSTMHRVDFAYTRQEIEVLFRYAHEHDVEKGGHYDARSAALNLWSHHWAHQATHWEPPSLWGIETDEGFNLEDLIRELVRWELQALGYVKHGDVPENA
jgi:hypothetical protein